MATDDDMSAMVGETEWLQDAQDIQLEPQPWELQHASKKPSKLLGTSILPGIDEQHLGPTSGPVLLPAVGKSKEGMLTGSQGENLEFCLQRWNDLGSMVDSMTAASRHLAEIDRKHDSLKRSQNKSRANLNTKANELPRNRRNSRTGDPHWESW